jgi:hypothetical protein
VWGLPLVNALKSSPARALLAALAILVVLVVAVVLAVLVLPSGRRVTPADLASAADRVSLPWRPSNDKLYPAASDCADCHPTQQAQWEISAHARASDNPLVHASICGRCHAPLGTQLDPEFQLKLYDKTPMPNMPAAASQGVTCVTCHSTVHTPEEQLLTFIPEWPNWRVTDLALEIQPFEQALGTFGAGSAEDPVPVANDSHQSADVSSMSSADLCKPCHEVVVDKGPLGPHCGLSQSRVLLLATYSEWAASPYADEGQTCQSCHMPLDPHAGVAAVAPAGTEYKQPLPPRPLASHTVLGLSTDYPKTGPEVDRQEALVAAFVKDAATVALLAPKEAFPGAPITVTATLTNIGAGHELPTGFAYWSEAWLEVQATDAGGQTIFASGDTDEDGWLRDEFNPRVVSGTLPYDAYLLSLRARLVSVGPNRADWTRPDGTLAIPRQELPQNLNGTPIIGPSYDAAAAVWQQVHPGESLPAAAMALWEGYVLRFADTVVRNGIPAKGSRSAEYLLDVPEGTPGPITVSARLLERALWPWMLRQQEELPTPRPLPKTYAIAAAEAIVPLRTP